MSSKRIHLVRHAQADHNVNFDNHSFPDAALTPTGQEQCLELNQRTSSNIQKSAQLLVTSPLRRTLQTTLIGFPQLIDELGGRSAIIALPQLQENGSSPADTGSSRLDLERDKEFEGIDFSLLDDGWNSKSGVWSSDEDSLRQRAGWTRKWLAARPEEEIVVVSHGGALRYITEDYADYEPWGNTEYRTYTFSNELSDYGGHKLVSALLQPSVS
ncbi:histidine phosphatase superfamily [Melampsora americana]|nr:histidine phosphatase superfamily [Melampsora americana]